MSATVTGTRDEPARIRFAWLNALLAAWIVGGTMLATRALNLGLADDVALSPYHLVAYAGLAALAGLCLALVIRARRRGVPVRRSLPAGFGTLGLGLLAAVGYVVLDIAWRETVGIADGIEGAFAPTRVLLVVALVLIAVGPLRAAMLGLLGPRGRWPVIASAALVLAGLTSVGGIHPAVGQWMDRPQPVAADDQEIWSMQVDGSEQTRLLDEADHVEVNDPAVSPDGARVAYTRWTRTGAGPDDWEADVWVAALDGSDARALAEGPGWQWLPHWSPDGAWIGYTVEPGPTGGGVAAGVQPRPAPGPAEPGFGVLAPPAAIGEANAELWRVAANGGAATRLTEAAGHDRGVDWAPDSARYVFDSDRDGDSEIWLQDGDGEPRQLTDDPAADWAPDWAPDGERIVFTSDRAGSQDLWLIGADGSGLTQLTDDPAADQGPTWSSDGARIAFVSDRTGESEIWSVAADGSDARNLSRSGSTLDGGWEAGDATPDGRLVFTRSAYGPADDAPLVRQDLALVELLLTGAALAGVAALVAALGAPLGAFTVLLGLWTLLMAMQWDAWRFVVGGVLAGVLVDAVLRVQRPSRRPLAAAVVAPGAYAAGLLGASAVTTGLAWTPTLAVGAVLACMAAGFAIGVVVAPRHERVGA